MSLEFTSVPSQCNPYYSMYAVLLLTCGAPVRFFCACLLAALVFTVRGFTFICSIATRLLTVCGFGIYCLEQDARNQLMPGQRKGVTYVSRLQSMQAAIDAQLEVCP